MTVESALIEKPVQFLFGDRELLIDVIDMLSTSVDAIVSPSSKELSQSGGLSLQLSRDAGNELAEQCKQLIREYGQIDAGMAVYTSAGKLDYKAIIHAVGPVMGDGDEQRTLEQAISRSLQLCEINQWRSVAFPAISAGHHKISVDVCAQALFRAITRFWDARHECEVEKIIICLTERNFNSFCSAFRDYALENSAIEDGALDSGVNEQQSETDDEQVVGEVDLSDQDLENLGDDEVDGWFK